MKKKFKWILPICFMMFVCVYLFMTPTGALRLGITMSGHPIEAITSTITEKSYDFYTKENQIGYSLENPPIEKETNSQLVNWNVTKYGVFYKAEYFGWG